MSLVQPEATGLLEHESVLLRLFRCMTEGEQECLLFEMLTKLAKRYSFDPSHKRLRPDDIKLELKDFDKIGCNPMQEVVEEVESFSGDDDGGQLECLKKTLLKN